jgi:hypothetical protein
VVEFFVAVRRDARVDVDSPVERLGGRVVDRRDGTPQRNATGVVCEVQRWDILFRDRREVGSTACSRLNLGGDARFRLKAATLSAASGLVANSTAKLISDTV